MKNQTNTGETLPAMKAAEVLGTTHLRILILIREGLLKGSQDGRKWVVTRDSLDFFLKHGGALRSESTCLNSCGKSPCSGHE